MAPSPKVGNRVGNVSRMPSSYTVRGDWTTPNPQPGGPGAVLSQVIYP